MDEKIDFRYDCTQAGCLKVVDVLLRPSKKVLVKI